MSKRGTSRKRAPFAAQVPRPRKRISGSTVAAATPLAIRTSGVDADPDLRTYVRERLGFKLGKFARHVERATVRFEDVNGPRGGVDTACRVKVVLSGLSSVVVEELAGRPYEAFDRAGDRVERAVRRTLERSRGRGLVSSRSRGNGKKQQSSNVDEPMREPGRRPKRRPLPLPEDGSIIGRRVGRAVENLARAADRPEKRRRDTPVDTALPGWSATDRRAGGGSTAARNTKLNTAKTTSTLEDSAKNRPSRKSTRKSANRSKRDSNLRRRQTRTQSALDLPLPQTRGL
jgi:ribosome-associated translation inhibitor RaiA